MWPDGVKLGWAMPLTWPYINSTTYLSLMSLTRPDFVYLETSRGGDIAEKREMQAEEALNQGCTHIWFHDADMVYPPNTLVDMFDLLSRGADLASVVCYRGYEPYNPLIWHPIEHRSLKPFTDYNFGDVVEAGAVGAACLLVKSEVFEKLERPWFRIQKEEKTENGRTIVIRRGEDTYFTERATRAGYKLRVLTSYDIGHLREVAVDRHFWITFMILNQIGSWEGAIQLLKKLMDKEWVKRELTEANQQERR